MKELNERKAFSFMRSYMDVINELSNEHAGELVKGLAHYQFTGEKPKFKGVLNAVWKGFEKLAESQVEGYLSGKQSKRSAPPQGGLRGGLKGGLGEPLPTKNKEQRIKSKEGINTHIPSLTEFLTYAQEKAKGKYELDMKAVELKYDAWVESGWMAGNPIRKIKNWKTTLCNTLRYLQVDKSKSKSEKEQQREIRMFYDEN